MQCRAIRDISVVFAMIFSLQVISNSVTKAQTAVPNLIPKDTSESSFLEQFTYSSIGFAIGFIPGGYQHIYNDTHGGQSTQALWILTAPMMSSLGVDLAYTNFWKKKNLGGSFWGGFAGGFLGEFAGGMIRFFLSENASPIFYYLAWWIPTSLVTIALYHGFHDDEPSYSTDVTLHPIITHEYIGGVLNIKF